MKRYAFLSVALALLATSAFAAEPFIRGKKEYMGACSFADRANIYNITNGSDAESCDYLQAAGDVPIFCACAPDDEGVYAWRVLSVAIGASGGSGGTDGVVLLAGREEGQTIQGRPGENQARIEIASGENPTQFNFYGPGESPASIYLRSTLVGFQSPTGYSVEAGAEGLMLYTGDAPDSAAEACSEGRVVLTSAFIYYCHSDSWVRAALSTW